MTAAHLDPVVIETAKAALLELQAQSKSMRESLVLTTDGFEVASHPATHEHAGRFASITSSLQALGDAVVRELRIGEGGTVIIGADEGHIIQSRVTGTNLVIAVQFTLDETLGKALAVTRVAATSLSTRLAAHPSAAAS